MDKRLIVNADDFGLSSGVNAGILAAHRAGIVTSASLMVRHKGAVEAAAIAAHFPGLSVGLHVDLGEWICRNGQWDSLYEVVCLEDPEAIAVEINAQLDRFRELTGKNPTHLDSHQHVHRSDPVRSIVLKTGREMGVPVRHFDRRIRYCGDFYGQTGTGTSLPEAVSNTSLAELLARLPAGITEMACHPGWDDTLTTMYCRERRLEVSALCDPLVQRELIAREITLISFAELSSKERAA